MAKTLHLVARMIAKPGKEKDLEGLLRGLIAPTRKEPGCLGYFLHRNQENPREFVFLEEWRAPADLDAHFETPHLKAAAARLPELLEGELMLHRLERLEGLDRLG